MNTIKKINFFVIFIILNVSINNISCCDNDLKRLDSRIHFWISETDFIYGLIYEFERDTLLKQELVKKWECEFNEFKNYQNSCSNLNAANYRFLRWLQITWKKLRALNRNLIKESNYIITQTHFLKLRENIDWLNPYCNSCISPKVQELIDDITQTRDLFERSQQLTDCLLNEISVFKEQVTNCLNELDVVCCCWF